MRLEMAVGWWFGQHTGESAEVLKITETNVFIYYAELF